MQTQHTVRPIQRVRYELRIRDVVVTGIEPLGSDFVRIKFGGDSLNDFESQGFDDHVKFMFKDENGEDVRRDYTPQNFDVTHKLLTIDFAIHGHGKASEWARHAVVGQNAVIGGPRGSMIVPIDFDWHLLIGDATAAPAIARRLAELPEHSHAIVVALIKDPAPLELNQSLATVELRQVASNTEMMTALRATTLPEGNGYAWAAGEASVMKQVRDFLIEERQHPREALRVAAYWKQGASNHHEELGR